MPYNLAQACLSGVYGGHGCEKSVTAALLFGVTGEPFLAFEAAQLNQLFISIFQR